MLFFMLTNHIPVSKSFRQSKVQKSATEKCHILQISRKLKSSKKMGTVLSLGNWATSLFCQSATLCITCANCFGGSATGFIASSSTTRTLYVLILGVISLLAFFLRNLGSKLDINLSSWNVHCVEANFLSLNYPEESKDIDVYCQGDAAVYRLSFVLSVFFLVFGIFSSASLQIHRGVWGLKIGFIFILSFIAFFIPNSFFDNTGFAWIARFGSIIFLLLQILILIDFAYDWGES